MSEKDQKRARSKQIAALTTAYGLGLLGAGLFDPLSKGAHFSWVSLACVTGGLVFHGASLYYAARSEKGDDE